MTGKQNAISQSEAHFASKECWTGLEHRWAYSESVSNSGISGVLKRRDFVGWISEKLVFGITLIGVLEIPEAELNWNYSEN